MSVNEKNKCVNRYELIENYVESEKKIVSEKIYHLLNMNIWIKINISFLFVTSKVYEFIIKYILTSIK